MLNLSSILEKDIASSLPEGKRILLFGVGGGFDIVSCLPLYYTLRMKGYDVELGNFSLVDFGLFPSLGELLPLEGNVYGTNGPVLGATDHYPEGHLTTWFKDGFDEDIHIWMIPRNDVHQTAKSMNAMVQQLDIGMIILCGAGARSIMMGDEEGCGEMLIPSIVLAATKQVEVPSILFITGINTAGEKKSESLYSTMENIQALVFDNAHLGSCSLHKKMDSFVYYKSGYEHIVDQHMHAKSPIHEMIITSVLGGFGPHKVFGGFICPEMSVCHFFDAMTVANYNLIIPQLEAMNDYDEVVQTGMGIIQRLNSRPRYEVPA